MNRYRQRDGAALASLPSDNPLHTVNNWVTRLITIFFGLSIMFFALTAMADAWYPNTISIYVWGRVITEFVLGAAYFLFAYLWRRGKFWGYLRMLMTSALAFVSTLSIVVLTGEYPWWLRFEQFAQFTVVVTLLYILIRPNVRKRFSKKSQQALSGRE